MLPQIRYNPHLFYSLLKKKKLKAHLCKSSDITWRKSKHSAWNAPKVSWISTSLRSSPPHFPTEQPREQCLFFSWSLWAQSCQSLTDGDHPSVLAQMMAVKVDCHAVMAFQQSKLYWFWKIEGVGQWLETIGCQTGPAYPNEELPVHDYSWPAFFSKPEVSSRLHNPLVFRDSFHTLNGPCVQSLNRPKWHFWIKMWKTMFETC